MGCRIRQADGVGTVIANKYDIQIFGLSVYGFGGIV